MSSPFDHLYAIEDRLDNERARLRTCKPRDRAFREHEIRMIEREIEGEKAFLAKRGIKVVEPVEMTLDEILAELEVK